MPTHYQAPPESILALNTFIKLSRASETLYARLTDHLRGIGVTHGQLAVLEALLHLGPLSQRALCDKLLKTGPNMTTVIDNLEKQKLVRRTPSEQDRRVFMIVLTQKGEALIRKAFPIHAGRIVHFLSALTKNEQETLGRLCKKLGLAIRQI